MSETPSELRYASTHEWARLEDDGLITVGITDHAQDQLGDVVYVELPEVDMELKAGQEAGVVESVKAASDLYTPVGGKVVAVNTALEETPSCQPGSLRRRLVLQDRAERTHDLDACSPRIYTPRWPKRKSTDARCRSSRTKSDVPRCSRRSASRRSKTLRRDPEGAARRRVEARAGRAQRMEMLQLSPTSEAGRNRAVFLGAGSVRPPYSRGRVGCDPARRVLHAVHAYQAEASQGTLQLIYEYQSMIASLTGMDVSERVRVRRRLGSRRSRADGRRANKKAKVRRVLAADTVHPLHRRARATS